MKNFLTKTTKTRQTIFNEEKNVRGTKYKQIEQIFTTTLQLNLLCFLIHFFF